MALSSIFKTFIIPPIIAFTIYLISIFIIIPLYQRRTRYAQYLPLSIPLSTSSRTRLAGSYFSRIRDRILDTLSPFSGRNSWHRRQSHDSEEGLFSDEELEEGFGLDETENTTREDRDATSGRRLSRELEVGFRDDSDEEVDRLQVQDARRGRRE